MLGIKVTELKRDEVSKEIAKKYFVNSHGMAIDRFHLPEMTADVYNSFMEKVREKASEADIKKIKEENFKFNTASKYYIDRVQKLIVAEDFKVNVRYISFKDYIKDENFYEWYNTDTQIYHYNCIYYTPSARDYSDVKREEYNTSAPNKELWDRLFSFCHKIILKHIALKFTKVEECMNMLKRYVNDSNGFRTNVTPKANAALESYLRYFKQILEDKEALTWIMSSTDFEDYSQVPVSIIEFYIKLYKNIGLDFTETEEFQIYCPIDASDFIELDFRNFGF